MSDKRLRQLERAASSNDPDVRHQLHRERARAGLCVTCGEPEHGGHCDQCGRPVSECGGHHSIAIGCNAIAVGADSVVIGHNAVWCESTVIGFHPDDRINDSPGLTWDQLRSMDYGRDSEGDGEGDPEGMV